MQEGGSVTSDLTFITGDSGATGTVIVSREGATWNNADDLFIVREGTGTPPDGGAWTTTHYDR